MCLSFAVKKVWPVCVNFVKKIGHLTVNNRVWPGNQKKVWPFTNIKGGVAFQYSNVLKQQRQGTLLLDL